MGLCQQGAPFIYYLCIQKLWPNICRMQYICTVKTCYSSYFSTHTAMTEYHPHCAVINRSHIHQQHPAVLLQQYCNVITSSLQCHNSSCINGIGGVKMYANFFFFVFSFKGKFTCWTIYLL